MSDINGGEVNDTNEINEVNETNENEEIDEDFEKELDDKYESQLNDPTNYEHKSSDVKQDGEKNKVDNSENSKYNDNAESQPERIKTRNEGLEGQEHPETGVPFEKRQVEVDGKQYEVVAPRFESAYDAQLPEDKLKSTDREQFKECNAQLKEAVENDPELREKFDEEQLEQIENGDTPDGYTWHHDVDVGKMQLVDTETHQKTAHTGGRAIWGGGSDNRY